MTPQQAINFLDQVTSQINANREVHGQIAMAISVIRNQLAPAPGAEVQQIKPQGPKK